MSEFYNLTHLKKEEQKKEITDKKNDEPPIFDVQNFDSQPQLDDSLLKNIPKLDYETLRHQVKSSLSVAKDMKYGDYNTAGLILSDLKLYIKNNTNSKNEVSDEVRKFIESYTVWLLSLGQKYTSHSSPDFSEEDPVDIFIRDYYGKKW